MSTGAGRGGRRGSVRASDRRGSRETPAPAKKEVPPPAAPRPPTNETTERGHRFWQNRSEAHVLDGPLGLHVGTAPAGTVIVEHSRHFDMFDDQWIETTGEEDEVVFSRRTERWTAKDPRGEAIWVRVVPQLENGNEYDQRTLDSLEEPELPVIDVAMARCAHALDCVVNDASMMQLIHAPSTPIDSRGMRDWNTEYQELLEGLMYGNPEIADDLRNHLEELVSEFLECVEEVTPTIITELFTSASKRTVHSVGAPGQGTYVHNGIYFRLCIDTPAGLFGGDSNAMKVASQVYKATSCLVKTAPYHFLHVPLTVVVSILGYRVVAQSIPPLHEGSLVCGSVDGGKTFTQPPAIVATLARHCAADLNLKLHDVGSMVQYGFPIDTQIHAAADGRFYIMNSWRLFPACMPLLRNPTYKSTAHSLTWRLRPEILQQSDETLSSDAFVVGASSAEDNVEAAAMLQWIRDVGIPMVSAMFSFLEPLPFAYQEEEKLCTQCEADLRCSLSFHVCWNPEQCCAICPKCYSEIVRLVVWEDSIPAAEAKAKDAVKCGAPVRAMNGFVMTPSISRVMHEMGINLRYMNYVLHGIRNTAHPATSHYFEIEMIARTTKHILASKLRTCRGPEEIAQTVTTLMQGLLHSDGEEAEAFWGSELGPLIQKKFSVLNPFDTQRLDRFLVYDRIHTLCGISLTSASVQSLSTSEPVIELEGVEPVVKTLIIPRLADPTGEKQTRAKSLVPQLRAFWGIRFDATGMVKDKERLPEYLK